MDAQLGLVSTAAYQNRKAELESQLLNQESDAANIEATFKQAALTLEANEQLYKDGLVSELQVKGFRGQVDELKNRLAIARKRLAIATEGVKSQLAPQAAEVNQRRANRLGCAVVDIKVKAACLCLQLVPVAVLAGSPTGPPRARRDPTNLKAECGALNADEDIRIGHPRNLTSNGIVQGSASHNPASYGGTVGVDVILRARCPQGARPASCGRTIRLESGDVTTWRRPSPGISTDTLFKCPV